MYLKKKKHRTANTDVKVTIAGVECTIISTSANQIQCETGSYEFSTIKASIEVNIVNAGLARNVNKLIIII